MRRRMLASLGGWKNPYITDGLIGMWDGEWNAGGGVHDDNCVNWINLAEKNDIAPGYCVNKQYQNTEWSDNSFRWNTATVYNNAFDKPTEYGGLSYEQVKDKVITCENVQRGIKFSKAGNWTCASMCPGAEVLFEISVKSIDTKYIGEQVSGVLSSTATHQINEIISYSGCTKCGEQKVVFRLNGGMPITTNSHRWSNGYTNKRNDFFPQVRCDVGNGIEVFNLRIYNRALTDAEITHNYEVDKARFDLT